MLNVYTALKTIETALNAIISLTKSQFDQILTKIWLMIEKLIEPWSIFMLNVDLVLE